MDHIKFVWEFALSGMMGGFMAVVVKCGYIELPKVKDGRVYLGGLIGLISGAVAGIIGDSSLFNAFIWGAGGTSLIQGLVFYADTQAKCISKKLNAKDSEDLK